MYGNVGSRKIQIYGDKYTLLFHWEEKNTFLPYGTAIFKKKNDI